MISTMRERMDTKCGNSNDNAFRIRKLFLAWDKSNSGMVHYEDLRQVGMSSMTDRQNWWGHSAIDRKTLPLQIN